MRAPEIDDNPCMPRFGLVLPQFSEFEVSADLRERERPDDEPR